MEKHPISPGHTHLPGAWVDEAGAIATVPGAQGQFCTPIRTASILRQADLKGSWPQLLSQECISTSWAMLPRLSAPIERALPSGALVDGCACCSMTGYCPSSQRWQAGAEVIGGHSSHSEAWYAGTQPTGLTFAIGADLPSGPILGRPFPLTQVTCVSCTPWWAKAEAADRITRHTLVTVTMLLAAISKKAWLAP